MSFDLTKFSDYVETSSDVLTATLFSGSDTGRFARFMTGVKGKTRVPRIGGVAELQKGTCKEPQGTTEVDEVELEVCEWTYYEGFCIGDLEKKMPNTVLAPGSNATGIPKSWEEKIVDVKVASIQKTLENTYWQGDVDGDPATGAYVLFDGFIKKIDAEAGVIEGNTSNATEITKANVKGLVDDMRTEAPTDVKRSEDFVILVGDDTFDKYIAKEKEDNLYHYKPEHDNGVYRIGGGRGILMRIYGLDGTQRMFASVSTNFIVGMDMDGEESIMDIWYEKKDDKLFFRTKAKSGVTIDNAEEIVEFTVGA